jgi:hypothetical protein
MIAHKCGFVKKIVQIADCELQIAGGNLRSSASNKDLSVNQLSVSSGEKEVALPLLTNLGRCAIVCPLGGNDNDGQ